MHQLAALDCHLDLKQSLPHLNLVKGSIGSAALLLQLAQPFDALCNQLIHLLLLGHTLRCCLMLLLLQLTPA